MKKFLMVLGLALAISATENKAHAYSSPVGVDPISVDDGTGNGGLGDIEVKQIKKSTVSGESDAITARRVLMYAAANDGYTVTRVVSQTNAGMARLACVSMDSIATGDTAYHQCITKGFVRLKYDAGTYPIVAGRQACVDANGVVRGCSMGNAEATAISGVVPLESKSSGSGEYLRALVNLR